MNLKVFILSNNLIDNFISNNYKVKKLDDSKYVLFL